MRGKDILQLFRKEIDENIIVKDSLIPTFRQLGERYSCSAATIKRMVDRLENCGVLHTVRGRGTFVAGTAIHHKRKHKQLIGCIVLNDPFKVGLEKMKDEYLKQKCFFSVYNASADLQLPEREKMFLELANEHDFCAIIMEATPREPVNTALFKRLRFDGMKIVNLSPYIDDMSDECFFMPDFYAAGQLGIVKCEVKQYRNLVFFRKKDERAPFVRAWEKGVRQMSKNMNIRILQDISSQDDDALVTELRGLPPSTAIFSISTELGERILQLARKNGISIPGDLGLISLTPYVSVKEQHSHFSFDYNLILHDALCYCLDRNRNALESIQQYYPPTFVDKHTL